MEMLKSGFLLLGGTLKRVWWYLPPLLLDPFDLLERLWGWVYPVPQWIAWALFGFGWFIAVMVTYHEMRIAKVRLEKKLEDSEKRKMQRAGLSTFLDEGLTLQPQCANERE